jgi:hypothetical protein
MDSTARVVARNRAIISSHSKAAPTATPRTVEVKGKVKGVIGADAAANGAETTVRTAPTATVALACPASTILAATKAPVAWRRLKRRLPGGD